MSGPAMLVDTNVLIYAEDLAEIDKHPTAMNVIATLAETGVGALSTQVLGEFSSVTVGKLAPSWDAADAWMAVDKLTRLFHVLEITLPVVRLAGWGSARYQMNYYDAQLWATAKLAGIPVVLTEDIPSAPEIEGVRYLDPFDPDFDIDALIAEVSAGG